MRYGQRNLLLSLFILLMGVGLVLTLLPRIAGEREALQRIRNQIEHFQTATSQFRELIISLRHGITINYDEGTYWESTNRKLLAEMEHSLTNSPLGLNKDLRRLKGTLLEQKEQWIHFKFYNSVIRNSLHFLTTQIPLLFQAIDQFEIAPRGHDLLSRSGIELLMLALGEEHLNSTEILKHLEEFKSLSSGYSTQLDTLTTLLQRHAEVIIAQTPKLNQAMKQLVNRQLTDNLQQLSEHVNLLIVEENTNARIYRTILIFSVLLLLISLGMIAIRYLGLQRQRREQSELLKNITDNISVGVLALDHQGNVIFANPQIEQMFAVKHENLLGNNFHAFGFKVDSNGNAIKSGDNEPSIESDCAANKEACYLKSLQGDIFPADVNTLPLHIEGGVGRVAVIQNITERLRNERDMRMASSVFDNSQQGIVITDRYGAIIRVNPAYCHITGYDPDELLGQNPRILKSGKQGKVYYKQMWQELQQKGHWQGEIYNKRKNGEQFVQWTSIDTITTDQGERLYVGITSDISELVETRERLLDLAYYDTLTSLPNRTLFHDRLAQSIVHARRDKSGFSLIMADLDNFKGINDTLGHSAGDELLIQVAQRLRDIVRESDTVARLSGDEFAIILSGTDHPEQTANVAQTILEELTRHYKINQMEIVSGASLGIVFYPLDGKDEHELLKNADIAMYRAKSQGKKNYQFFTQDMADNAIEAMRIENGLRHALENNGLALYYQPQIDLEGNCLSAEALMRWQSDEMGWISPARFIPIAERSDLIVKLGDLALRKACIQCKIWRQNLDPDFSIAVNLSPAQFRHEGLIEQINSTISEFGLPGSAIELEITESVIMEDVDRGQQIIEGLKRLGCRLSIDDFGTGYSSLAYLKRFKVDVLKIDKSFIDGLGMEKDDTLVVNAIVSLASSLKLDLVAEGVETLVQIESLKEIVDKQHFLSQGYFYSPPLPAETFEMKFPRFRQLQIIH